MSIERYLFQSDVEEFFYEKLDHFHDIFVLRLLLTGMADKVTNLERIKMTKMPEVSLKYCEKIVGGFKNIAPSAIVSLLNDKNPILECVFTEMYSHTFMIQNIMDYPQLGKFNCQVWYLGEIGVDTVKNYWE